MTRALLIALVLLVPTLAASAQAAEPWGGRLTSIDERGAWWGLGREPRPLLGADELRARLTLQPDLGRVFDEVIVHDEILVGVHVEDARVTASTLVDATVERAELVDVGLDGATVARSSIEGGTVASSSVDRSRISHAGVHTSRLTRVDTHDVGARDSILQGGTHVDATLLDSSVRGARVVDATITGGAVIGSELVHVTLQDVAVAPNVRLCDVTFVDTDESVHRDC